MKLSRLTAAIGYEFRDIHLLEQALTHRSFGSPNNERLEFLGDSVLNCVVSQALYARFDKLQEGDLSRWRAGIVRQESLAGIANSMMLGDYLKLGDGEQKSGGRQRPSIVADALEALFGAVFVDAGFDAASRVITALIQPALNGIIPNESGKDSKTALQEALQGRGLALPRYELVATRGAAHEQEFKVECKVVELNICTMGLGRSRRMAEQSAAKLAIEELR
jgi:ribonuclease-3